MKKTAAFLMALIAVLCCASCGTASEPNAASSAQSQSAQPQTAAEWVDLLARSVSFDDQMTSVPDRAAAVYGIVDEDGYTGDCALYISAGATPEEIAVFRTDSALSADDLTSIARARLDRQMESFADYRPDEVPKLETAVVRTCGDFVIVCVCADNAKADELLSAYA